MIHIKRFTVSAMRFFRLVRTPLLIGVILGFAIGMVIVINNTNKTLEESRADAKKHQELMQDIIEEVQIRTKAIDDHLDCILEYFSTERRGGLYIEYTKECRLRRSKQPVSQTEPSKSVATTQVTPRPVAPRPVPPPNPPREADRSFLDCSTTERRKRLKKALDKETYKRICK